jgi:hypothetical protein
MQKRQKCVRHASAAPDGGLKKPAIALISSVFSPSPTDPIERVRYVAPKTHPPTKVMWITAVVRFPAQR